MEYKKLDELLEYIQPTKYIVDSENYDDSFPTPVLTAGKSFILGYTDETNGIYFASKENPIILFDDFTTECKLVDFAFKVKSSACKILKPKKDINIKYVYYAMKNIDIDTSLHKRYWISIYSQQTIPFPIPIIQENIVSEIEVINETIEYNEHKIRYLEELIRSKFIEMFGDPMFNNKNYNIKYYGELFVLNAGGTPSKSKLEYWDNGKISWIGSNLCQNVILYENDGKYITELGFHNSSAKMFPIDTVLIALVGATIGKTALLKFETTTNQNVLGVRGIKEAGYNPMFVYYYTQFLHQKFMNIGDGGFNMASKDFISKLPIFDVSLNEQDKFASFAQQIDKSKLIVQQEIKLLNELLEVKTNEYFS